MKKDIINFDEQGKLHGQQITHHTNGNIWFITNYHHGKRNGYQAWFNPDKSIEYKSYFNMTKSIYTENHEWDNQIQIKI